MKKENKFQDLQILEALLGGNLTGEEKKIIEQRLMYDPEFIQQYETLEKLPEATRRIYLGRTFDRLKDLEEGF